MGTGRWGQDVVRGGGGRGGGAGGGRGGGVATKGAMVVHAGAAVETPGYSSLCDPALDPRPGLVQRELPTLAGAVGGPTLTHQSAEYSVAMSSPTNSFMFVKPMEPVVEKVPPTRPFLAELERGRPHVGSISVRKKGRSPAARTTGAADEAAGR